MITKAVNKDNKELVDFIEYKYPELKESEDEKIRKWLIEMVSELRKVNSTNANHNGMCSDAIAWLEKQEDANKEYWRGYKAGKQEIIDKYSELEKQGEQKEINLVEILKHYPKETELYSPLYGKLWLAEVDEEHEIITCYKHPLSEGDVRAILEQEDTVSFYSNGTTGLPDFSISKDCMLFLYDSEKQGRQKPVDKVESKFKVGDWVVCCNYEPEQIIGIKNNMYEMSNGDIRPFYMIDNNHNMRLWTIQDAKDGDVLANDWYDNDNKWEKIVIFKHFHQDGIEGYGNTFKNGELAWKDENVPYYSKTWTKYLHPATKEQRDLLFSKMEEAGMDMSVVSNEY